MSKTIAVIIPAYNEEDAVYKMYNELVFLSRELKEYKLKIIFVNDCSSDKTLDVLKRIKNEDDGVGIVDLKQRSGEWIGFRTALLNLEADYVTSLPADLQIPVEIIERFIQRIKGNKDLEVVFAQGYPHGNNFFSTVYWSWLFLRFNKKIIKKEVDTFLMNKKMTLVVKGNNEFYNVVPFEIFKSKNYKFIRFRKSPRVSGGSKYNIRSKARLFVETLLLSLGMDLFGCKELKYEVLT